MDYVALLGAVDCPYEWSLADKPGTQYPGKPPYPEIVVLRSDSTHVRELRTHSMRVRVYDPATEAQQEVEIVRLVGVLEGGAELEFSRTAVPAEIADARPIDPGHCAGCGKPIPPGCGVAYEGHMYHLGTCYEE